ncbi:MAG: ribonuclease Z [Sarcina sp.]
MLDIVILGIGGGMPLPGRYLSSTLLNFNGRKILIDCGEGTQVSMREVGCGFKSIDIICITHGHGDHTVGLPGLLATIGNSDRTDPLTIIGPVGIKEIVNGLRVIAPFLPYEINIIEATNSSFKFSLVNDFLSLSSSDKNDFTDYDALNISTLELNHSTDCIGYKFNINRAPKFDIEKALANNVPKNLWGTLQKGNSALMDGISYFPSMVLGKARKGITLSYITDTRYKNEIIPFIENSDLFICEGTYGDNADIEKAIKNKHMTFKEAATLASKGNVSKLLLTHFSPAMPNPSIFTVNAKEIFENTFIAQTHMRKKLNFLSED